MTTCNIQLSAAEIGVLATVIGLSNEGVVDADTIFNSTKDCKEVTMQTLEQLQDRGYLRYVQDKICLNIYRIVNVLSYCGGIQ